MSIDANEIPWDWYWVNVYLKIKNESESIIDSKEELTNWQFDWGGSL